MNKDIIFKLFSSSNREDHMLAITLLCKDKGFIKLRDFFDEHGHEDGYTIEQISKKALVLDFNKSSYGYKYYETESCAFYVSPRHVYLVKPYHPHRHSWDPIKL